MKEMKFEEAIEKLEAIAKDLESGELTLDESVNKFEEGIKLSKTCTKILNEAEKKINILIEQDGEIKEEKFCSEE